MRRRGAQLREERGSERIALSNEPPLTKWEFGGEHLKIWQRGADECGLLSDSVDLLIARAEAIEEEDIPPVEGLLSDCWRSCCCKSFLARDKEMVALSNSEHSMSCGATGEGSEDDCWFASSASLEHRRDRVRGRRSKWSKTGLNLFDTKLDLFLAMDLERRWCVSHDERDRRAQTQHL
jgi:hypothetical protein